MGICSGLYDILCLIQFVSTPCSDSEVGNLQAVLSIPGVCAYAYDTEEELWCEVTFKVFDFLLISVTLLYSK